jgi:asparagine synthetase B (glutamine-hydrolysing)
MCGILFILWTKRISEERRKAVIDVVREAVASRGPEAHNHVSSTNVDMIFHRLATYGELSSDNMMPIKISNQDMYLLCNGDIYNYKHFQSKNRVSNNDCEVIP